MMKFQITVGQNDKFLFRTSIESCESVNALERVFAIFARKFPASEGFYMYVQASWEESMHLNKGVLIEAINMGKGRRYIRRMKNKKDQARWMATLIYKHMEEGLL